MHDPDKANDDDTQPQRHDQPEENEAEDHKEELLDESLKETFPASDPPSTY